MSHPIAGQRPVAAVARYAAWQMRLRVQREASYGWIDGAQLLVRSRGGRATGNVYCGLQEFADMAFVLHLLRPNDLYVEVGAADGAYAVLAGRCCGAPVARDARVQPLRERVAEQAEALRVLRARLAAGGVAVFNLLPVAELSWAKLMDCVCRPFAEAREIRLRDYDNRIVIASRSELPSAALLRKRLESRLDELESRLAGTLAVRRVTAA